jgi:hypothetical protein
VGAHVRHLVQILGVEVADELAGVGALDGRVGGGISAVFDRGQAVASLVVAGVVGDTGDAAVDGRRLGRLDPFCAGEQAARRGAGADERVVVGAPVERGRLRGEACPAPYRDP